ncbi:hypothetical protein CKJ70_26005 [Mycobacterium avium]|uniref:Helicase-associated domain-containing protein n=2 Tax=Mycobacterium avium TaxID=1764 RepID=A0AAI8X5B4_MYCAV|nr:hypothetical protein CKJ70_26005 [Mycobacterium avium]BBN50791.1 hypothetical protein JPH1_52660 [Mycobacterium avium subsp. hominissuis]
MGSSKSPAARPGGRTRSGADPQCVCMRRPHVDFIDTKPRVTFGTSISVGRISRLAADGNWHNGLRALAAFKAAYGHLQVPRSYRAARGEPLGKWFDNQKVALRAGTLPVHRRAALAELGPAWFAAARPAPLAGAPVDPVAVGESGSGWRVLDGRAFGDDHGAAVTRVHVKSRSMERI